MAGALVGSAVVVVGLIVVVVVPFVVVLGALVVVVLVVGFRVVVVVVVVGLSVGTAFRVPVLFYIIILILTFENKDSHMGRLSII